MINKFIPGVNRLNLHTVAAWSVLVGAYSEIILETVSNDLDLLEKALVSRDYRNLKYDLLNYITNYKTKGLTTTGKKDTYSTDIREETIKFTQTWDVITEAGIVYYISHSRSPEVWMRLPSPRFEADNSSTLFQSDVCL